MEELGIPPDKVWLGYDAVDNGYFAREAAAVRAEPERWRSELSLPERFFLTCCRFVGKKNLPRLMRAYRSYRERSERPWDLVMCGDGPLADDLRARAGGLAGIHWPGFVQIGDLPKYYGLASAFALPSTTEQWGLVVNEAMASGLPVLVSDRAGCRYDLVQDGVNGWLFDPYDVGDMADEMLRMSSLNDEERQRMGNASIDIIANWGPDRFAQGLWQAIQAAQRRKREANSIASRLVLRLLTHPLLCARKK
ncbi:MAG: glycosyltransferase family 4 protein [Candidatus Brocadiae bacterium]|nr:glycosyltransferase family 4 protein [Candidatus Brocadiia bacterium]